MTRPPLFIGHRQRILVLAVGLPLYAVVLTVVTTFAIAALVDPSDALDTGWEMLSEPAVDEPAWWAWCVVPVLLLVGTQALFVVPLFKVDLQPARRSRSVLVGLVMAAVVAAALTVGLACGFLELLNLWEGRIEHLLAQRAWGWPITLPLFVTSWILWSAVFVVFTRKKRHAGLLGRLVTILLAGTVVEALAVIPIDIMVRRRTDCYCATGTFYALLIATLAAMWLSGPGVAILYLRRRRRMAAVSCVHCGYPKGPSPGPLCPECGYAWEAAISHKP